MAVRKSVADHIRQQKRAVGDEPNNMYYQQSTNVDQLQFIQTLEHLRRDIHLWTDHNEQSNKLTKWVNPFLSAKTFSCVSTFSLVYTFTQGTFLHCSTLVHFLSDKEFLFCNWCRKFVVNLFMSFTHLFLSPFFHSLDFLTWSVGKRLNFLSLSVSFSISFSIMNTCVNPHWVNTITKKHSLTHTLSLSFSLSLWMRLNEEYYILNSATVCATFWIDMSSVQISGINC